jgi:hypothetical protein
MSVQMVLLPLFAMVLLPCILSIRMFLSRRNALVKREVRIADIALGEKVWPQKTTQVNNAYANQFEMPVLFFVLVALALPLRQADLVFVLLSWLFVILRYVHAGIHVTTNNVKQRGPVFGLGVLVLFSMWIYFALKILLAI